MTPMGAIAAGTDRSHARLSSVLPWLGQMRSDYRWRRRTKSSHRNFHCPCQLMRVSLGNVHGWTKDRGEGDDGDSGSEMAHDVPRFTSPRWRITTSC
jgi:hypothetical protein